MTEFSNAPLRIGDELVYYYGSSSWGKNHPRPYRVSGGGIFRARLRPDGFVSVDRGSLVTRRMNFDGRDLYVNGVGPITVEVVTAADSGVTKLATATIRGDSLQEKVVFDGNRSLREVAPDGTVQLSFTVGEGGALYSFTIDPDQTVAASVASSERKQFSHVDGMVLKKESFDRDPSWEGVNNRSATTRDPIKVRQDFGYSAKTAHAGGHSPGEVGGFITAAGEAAFYGKAIDPATFDQPLSATGKLTVGKGGTNMLLGFFNSNTLNEWRTPNTIAIRLNGRGDKFFAYVEYCTSKWRAGGDTKPFPSVTDPQTGRWNLNGYPCDKSVRWSLTYNPKGNDGKGIVIATIGNDTAECKLDAGHKADGASFNRFGILNVMKSVDSGSEVWVDDVAINGGVAEAFDRDPRWDGRNNRQSTETRMVRPWFDFGFSDTTYAGGKAKGELGGQIFRGDCRESERMACYGDRVEPLTLNKSLKASGKIVMTRGVSDSTTFFGFYHSRDSMREHALQNDSVPENVLGIHIEGPSSEGFKFYPVLHVKSRGTAYGEVRQFSTIYPDRKSHDWSLEYDPKGAEGKGQVAVTLDGKSGAFDLPEGYKAGGAAFDRFGIVTSWIDGNNQMVYLDDITYTYAQK